MSNELKPCPFCGSSLDIFFEDSYKGRLGCYLAELRCFRCGASIHGYGNTKEVSEDHARHRWNTRAEREVGISKFQKITGTSYIEAKSILTSLEQAGAKVVEP